MPCFALEPRNNGLENIYVIPISFTVLGGNRKRISKCVLYRVFLCSIFEVSFIGGSIIQHFIACQMKSTEVLNPRCMLQRLFLHTSYNTSPKLCRSGALWSIL